MDLIGKNVLILGQGISGNGAMMALQGISRPYFCDDGWVGKDTIRKIDSNLGGKTDKINSDLGERIDKINSDLGGRIDKINLDLGCRVDTKFGGRIDKINPKPDIIVISPGIATHPIFEYAKRTNTPIISELELGFILSHSPVVAITGTNGKTTVTRLIASMTSTVLKTAICGNIGTAFSLASRSNPEVNIVEASSFQLLNCYEFKPKIAVITNITADHLDRHKTMDEYIKAKFRISQNQDKDDFLVLPFALAVHSKNTRPRTIHSDLNYTAKNGVLRVFGEDIIPLEQIKLVGKHNLMNVVQAVIASKILGISNGVIARAIADFVPDPHRMQRIALKRGKAWFDDSKATNIDACVRACESMGEQTALILGGSDKGYEFDELFMRLPKQIVEIFVMGQVTGKLIESASRCGVKVKQVANLDEAVVMADRLSVKNVLLSPACASFDCYIDYKERGRHFETLVKNL